MPANKSTVRVDADLFEAFGAVGALTQIVTEFRSGYYVKSIMDYAHTVAASEFDAFAFSQAAARPDRFHHVFEPNHPGEPGFQLWSHRLVRPSSLSSERQITWAWRQSKLPIRTPMQRKRDPYGADPMAKISMAQLAKLSDRRYVFHNRAMMMEYGLRATVTPKQAKALFVPMYGGRPSKRSRARGFIFKKRTEMHFENSNPQMGINDGEGTVGNFTQLWVTFWNGPGEITLTECIERAIRDDVVNSDILVKATRRRRGKIKLTVSPKDNMLGFAAGRDIAAAHFKGKARSYKQAAKYAQKNSWGDIPFAESEVGYE